MVKHTSSWIRACGLGLLAAVLLGGSVQGAVDAYLKVEGVKGLSRDDKHKDWMEVHSVGWGTLRQEAESERGGRAVRHETLVITKEWDAASPKLQQACASGKHFASIDLDVMTDGQLRHYHLMNVTVSSFRMIGGGNRPTAELSLNFTKIVME